MMYSVTIVFLPNLGHIQELFIDQELEPTSYEIKNSLGDLWEQTVFNKHQVEKICFSNFIPADNEPPIAGFTIYKTLDGECTFWIKQVEDFDHSAFQEVCEYFNEMEKQFALSN